MRAITFHGARDVRVSTVPEPAVVEPTDAIVRVDTTAICGSDLHLYTGRMEKSLARQNIQPGFVIGHEFIGRIEAIGSGVRDFTAGDRVVAAFTTSCGKCANCRRSLPAHCRYGQMFGFGSLAGGQAEYVRVPWADTTLDRVPDAIPDDQGIFIGDIFATGYMAAEYAEVRPGDTVAVFGAGPVGLFSTVCAGLRGAAAIFAIDLVAERLALAARLGATPINAAEVDPVRELRKLTGDGPDAAIEAVGSAPALQNAVRCVRPGGRIASVGVYIENVDGFPMGNAFNKTVTLRTGVCQVRNYTPHLIELIRSGRVDLSQIVTDRLPLDQAPEGFQRFADRAGNTVKVLLRP